MRRFEQDTARGIFGERGFSLLEGMIASAILSVGLLGLAAMQGVAMVRNVDANELTNVTAIASDILERVQFNRKNAANYDGIDTTSATNCAAITQVQANGDCRLWSARVTGTNLQNVRGQVTVSNLLAPTVLSQRDVTVTLTWMGSQNGGSSVKRLKTLTINRRIAPE